MLDVNARRDSDFRIPVIVLLFGFDRGMRPFFRVGKFAFFLYRTTVRVMVSQEFTELEYYFRVENSGD